MERDMEKSETMTYSKALEALEEILRKVGNPEIPLTEVEKEVKRAMELIAFCRGELSGYKERFDKIMED